MVRSGIENAKLQTILRYTNIQKKIFKIVTQTVRNRQADCC